MRSKIKLEVNPASLANDSKPEKVSGKSPFSIHKKILLSVLVLLFLGSTVSAGFFFYKYQQVKQNNPALEIEKITKLVGKLIELPQGETPTLATVSDRDKLVDQEFFQKAENGDKVLVYMAAGKAVLYRPQINKIIDVAPIRKLEESEQPEIAGVQDVSEYPTVSLYNGTFVSGLTRKAEAEITDSYSEYEIVVKKNATQRNYIQTLVYDASGQRKEEAQRLADLFKGQMIFAIPKGEVAPSSDILVIIGSEYSTGVVVQPTVTPVDGVPAPEESPDIAQ